MVGFLTKPRWAPPLFNNGGKLWVFHTKYWATGNFRRTTKKRGKLWVFRMGKAAASGDLHRALSAVLHAGPDLGDAEHRQASAAAASAVSGDRVHGESALQRRPEVRGRVLEKPLWVSRISCLDHESGFFFFCGVML